MVPENYEVKLGRARRYFAGPTFGYAWSEVDCDFMDEAIIDIDKELAILGEPQGRPRTLGAGSVFFVAIPPAATNEPCFDNR